MRVLDLFSGLGGFSSAFRERGHEVVGIEREPELVSQALESGDWRTVIQADVREVEPEALLEAHGPFEVVVGSPPCQTFGVMTISVYWNSEGYPDHPLTHDRLALVHDTLALIHRLRPDWFVLENPRAMLRNQAFMGRWDRETVTYCQYGHFMRKPTDLWGGFPPAWNPRPTCAKGDPCHDQVRREDTGGTQVEGDGWEARMREAWQRNSRNRLPEGLKSAALRSLVPYELSEAVCRAAEESEGSWWELEAERPEQVRLSDVAGRDG